MSHRAKWGDDPEVWFRDCDLCGQTTLWKRTEILWLLTEGAEFDFDWVRACEMCYGGIPACEMD